MSRDDSLRQEARAIVEAEKVVAELVECSSKAEIAEVMKGQKMSVFMLIDEKPGLFTPSYTSGDWFAWLRQLRNDPESDLFTYLV